MAWTITATIDAVYNVCSPMGNEMVKVKLACISDANATDTKLSSVLSRGDFMDILGGWLYEMKVVPGTGDDVPTAAWDIDIEDNENDHILDTDSNANDANTFHDGAKTIGHYPVIEEDPSFVSATLGAANTCTIYFKILKG